jgi:hypothetical protein
MALAALNAKSLREEEMSQSVVNSGQFRRPAAVKPVAIASGPDNRSAAPASVAAMWPMAIIAVGGIATVAWDGFLVWQIARVLMMWLGTDT